MRRILIPFLMLFTISLSGFVGWHAAKTSRVSAAETSSILYYMCPMHPKYTSDKPGDCPSCGMRLVPKYAEENGSAGASAAESLPAGAVSINPEKQQMIGVRTAIIERAPIDYSMRTVGRVAADETKIARIQAADGWVEEVYPNSADSMVQKDQLLAKFYSKEFITAQLSYIYNVDAPDRVSKERQDKSISYIQARSADKELRSLGMSDYQMKEIGRTRQPATVIEVRAPITGYVLARNISPGMKFNRDSELYRIADLSHVWILADLYENEVSYYRPGMDAKVTLPQQGKTVHARISSVLPQFDPVSRTLKVRLEMDNPGYVFRPDMFVDVEIPVHKPPAIFVDADAIIDTGVEKRVYFDLGNGHFAPRTVKTGARFKDKMEIVQGVTPGERIVVSSAFLIDSESRMKPEDAVSAPQAEKAIKAKDPVCGMDVELIKDTPETLYKGKTYYFCSKLCKKSFDGNPGKYVIEPKSDKDMRMAGMAK